MSCLEKWVVVVVVVYIYKAEHCMKALSKRKRQSVILFGEKKKQQL